METFKDNLRITIIGLKSIQESIDLINTSKETASKICLKAWKNDKYYINMANDILEIAHKTYNTGIEFIKMGKLVNPIEIMSFENIINITND